MLDAYKRSGIQSLNLKMQTARATVAKCWMAIMMDHGCRVISPDPTTILELENHINKMKQGDTKIWCHPLQ